MSQVLTTEYRVPGAPLMQAMSSGADGLARPLALLELLHPDGRAGRRRVVGSGCPAALRPVGQSPAGEVDLCVLAPSVGECRAGGWLVAQVARLAHDLAPGGLVYVLAPAPARRRIVALLRGYGLLDVTPIAHVPDPATSAYLVPLSAGPVQYALVRLLPGAAWRRLAAAALRLPGGPRLLGGLLPSVGLAVRRPGDRPLCGWLLPEAPARGGCSVILGTSWRGPGGAVILHYLPDRGAQPLAIAKLSLAGDGAGRIGEAAALSRLGPVARAAGARVPYPLRLAQLGGQPVLLQSALDGHPAAALLAAEPDRLLDLLERVAGWLESWNRSTAVARPLDRSLLGRELLAPAELLAPLLSSGERYLEWLAARCDQAAGARIALVAAHNDLTMANVLVDAQGRLGIIDWETARPQALPLLDFCYMAVDAVAAAGQPADRPGALAACFAPGGRYSRIVAALAARLAGALGLAPELAELCFHACWLHHAANEQRASATPGPRPFLAIVQRLAESPSLAEGWAHGIV